MAAGLPCGEWDREGVCSLPFPRSRSVLRLASYHAVLPSSVAISVASVRERFMAWYGPGAGLPATRRSGSGCLCADCGHEPRPGPDPRLVRWVRLAAA